MLYTKYVDVEQDELTDLFPFDDPRQLAFDKCFYEERLDYEVDMETGEATLVGVNGRKLEPSS